MNEYPCKYSNNWIQHNVDTEKLSEKHTDLVDKEEPD